MKKILILGKQSPIAVAVYELILKETDWIVSLELDNYTHSDSDEKYLEPIFYDKKTIRKVVMDYNPGYIINLLSYDIAEKCEEHRKECWDFNVGTVEALSKAAFMTEAKLIVFSSDNIFDGTNGPYSEDVLPNPLNYYGKTKLGCDNLLLASSIPFTSIRLPEYYGNNNSIGSNIFYNIINKKSMSLSVNSFTNPILLDDIALGVIKIIEGNKTGFYHFGGPDYISEYEYANKIVDYLGMDKSLILPYTYSSENAKIKKYLRGGLINLKSEVELGINFVNLHSGLTTVRFQINYNN